MDAITVSLALTSATQASNSFPMYMPKFSEIRQAKPDDPIAADVRLGEIAAITITLGIGVIASYLSSSSVPAIAGAVMCAILVGLYEYALSARSA